MNGLALCAGIGGLELGLCRVWPDLRTVCWVERDHFAASILVSRMREGALDEAPVWDDLSTFNGAAWRGCVDLVSAGYPCQPFSVAGKRGGEGDDRHLWPHVARVIRDVGPRWVVLENVPGHVTLGLPDVLGELAEMGYDAEWGCYTAEQAGCAHRRERLFVLAHRDSLWEQQQTRCLSEGRDGTRHCRNTGREQVANATGTRQHEGQDAGAGASDARADWRRSAEPQRDRRDNVAHAESLHSWIASKQAWRQGAIRGGQVGHASCRVEPEQDDTGAAIGGRRQQRPIARWASLRPPGPGESDAWEWIAANDADALPAVEPGVRGVADGLPEKLEPTVRRHRLRCLGNAVVPAQAALAVSDLLGGLSDVVAHHPAPLPHNAVCGEQVRG